ncbi:MAG: HlyD family efflux transporter periplasmic adaptor subunit [Spirochaetes bacterium]|nr:MAG: HlyD family efflux transporter periplasmic adaptor subunit [Spirochaetota bacterium]
MKNRKRAGVLAAACVIGAAALGAYLLSRPAEPETVSREAKPFTGDISVSIATTGTVQPRNRLEIKPAINGRIEEVLVSEGQAVRTGQVLVWMSSTERAALIDAARAQGGESTRYWEEAYKPIPVVSLINGTVIVRGVEPGATVSTTTAILVISDRLIVKADVDETDIGRVKTGQRAVIGLDAYPEVKVGARVDLISYESTVVNNVTMYKVEIIPDSVPEVFRSGMSANVSIVEKSRKKALLVPSEAIISDSEERFVTVKGRGKTPEKRAVTTGIADDKNTEILTGLTGDETLIIVTKKFTPASDAAQGKNPFQPERRKPR